MFSAKKQSGLLLSNLPSPGASLFSSIGALSISIIALFSGADPFSIVGALFFDVIFFSWY